VTFVVAHGAGNDLALLDRAERLGVRLVEADVRLWRGRAEVRHLKTAGPLPVLWDRWRLESAFAPRLQLDELLAAARPGTELLLDLKGRRARLADLVLDALPTGRPVTLCARSERLLEPFAGRPGVKVFRSVGTRRQLRAVLARSRPFALDGVSVHARLLDERVVERLRSTVATVITWPVDSVARARELAGLGVHGLISADPSRLLGPGA
jgi:glycerophosphoryl diester phosphodiesterase